MARNNQARLVFTRKFLRDVVMPSRKSSGSKPAQGAKKRWCKEVAQPGNKINNGTKAQQQQPKDALGHREGGEGGAGPPTRASGKVLKVFHGKKSTEDDKKPAATRQPARTSPRNKRCLSTTDSSPPLKRLKNLDMGVQEKQKKVEFIQPKVGDRVYCLHSRLGWYWGEATKKFWKQCKLYYSVSENCWAYGTV